MEFAVDYGHIWTSTSPRVTRTYTEREAGCRAELARTRSASVKSCLSEFSTAACRYVQPARPRSMPASQYIRSFDAVRKRPPLSFKWSRSVATRNSELLHSPVAQYMHAFVYPASSASYHEPALTPHSPKGKAACQQRHSRSVASRNEAARRTRGVLRTAPRQVSATPCRALAVFIAQHHQLRLRCRWCASVRASLL